jgi:hypothetical protein
LSFITERRKEKVGLLVCIARKVVKFKDGRVADVIFISKDDELVVWVDIGDEGSAIAIIVTEFLRDNAPARCINPMKDGEKALRVGRNSNRGGTFINPSKVEDSGEEIYAVDKFVSRSSDTDIRTNRKKWNVNSALVEIALGMSIPKRSLDDLAGSPIVSNDDNVCPVKIYDGEKASNLGIKCFKSSNVLIAIRGATGGISAHWREIRRRAMEGCVGSIKGHPEKPRIGSLRDNKIGSFIHLVSGSVASHILSGGSIF